MFDKTYLIESSLYFIAEMSSPNGGQVSQSLGGFYVSNNTNYNERRSSEDGNSLDNFLFVDF